MKVELIKSLHCRSFFFLRQDFFSPPFLEKKILNARWKSNFDNLELKCENQKSNLLLRLLKCWQNEHEISCRQDQRDRLVKNKVSQRPKTAKDLKPWLQTFQMFYQTLNFFNLLLLHTFSSSSQNLNLFKPESKTTRSLWLPPIS